MNSSQDILVLKLEAGGYLGDVCVDEKIILKWSQNSLWRWLCSHGSGIL